MGFLAAFLLPVLNSLFGNLITPFVKAWTDYKLVSLRTTEEGFIAAAGADAEVYKAYLASQAQIQQMKLAQSNWWGAHLLILVIGGAAAVHFAAVCFVSTFPQWGWRVAALPAPIDNWEGSIILSFFIVAPALPVVSAVTKWLGRK